MSESFHIGIITYSECKSLTPVYYNASGSVYRNVSSSDSITRSSTANGFRIPTEAQWECAAGGGNVANRTKYFGTSNVSEYEKYAWIGSNSGGETHPVGTKLPNSLGIYDMMGNVWEWCWDGTYSYSADSQTNEKVKISTVRKHPNFLSSRNSNC